MARVNVYLPDDLARSARKAGMNISALTRAAIERELGAQATGEWIRRVKALPPLDVTHEQVLAALDEAREEFGRRNS